MMANTTIAEWRERALAAEARVQELEAAARRALENTDMDEVNDGCDCPACSAVRNLQEVVG